MIFNLDCREGLKNIESNSVDMCLTDPPYFLKNLDDGWNSKDITDSIKSIKTTKGRKSTINNLPSGMEFDITQGILFQEFYQPICREIYRVLKPGAFFLSFSSTRLYHRMSMAIENAGFEIRDMISWSYNRRASKSILYGAFYC